MLSPHLLELVLVSVPDAIVITDASGRIEFANERATTLFGCGIHELLGSSVEQLLPERLRQNHRDQRARFTEAPRARLMGEGLELFACRRDGTEFPVEISLSPIHDRERLLVVAAIRDVTEQRRVERELIVARESAEQACALADEASKAKSRFLSTASHDLRQPVQSLALSNGALRRLVSEPAVLEVLGMQERAIISMTRLLNALLDISRLESGAICPEITKFSADSLLEGLHQEFAGIAREKGIALHVEQCRLSLCSDPALLEQVMRNLVANAIKYTPAGEVRVRCTAGSCLAWLEVIDTGVGIPQDKLPHIFEEFFRVGARSSDGRSGYGLGLSIVNRIVRLLGLQLEVQSEPGAGSCFRLGVPAGGEG